MNSNYQLPEINFTPKSVEAIEFLASRHQLEIEAESASILLQFKIENTHRFHQDLRQWQRNNVEMFLVKTIDTPFCVEYKIISSLPGFSWSKRMQARIPNSTLDPSAFAHFEAEAQRDFERAKGNPFSNEFYN